MDHLKHKDVEAFAHQHSKGGNPFCGDSFFFHATEDYFLCVLADGLGSGQFAFESSSAVTHIVKEYADEDVESLMKRCNSVLLHKRGAAVGIVKAYFKEREFVYSCVGNIRFYAYSPVGKMMYPLPVTGYLSGKSQVYRTQRFPYLADTHFLIHSDGIEIRETKSLLQERLSVLQMASSIQRLHQNIDDDATFIVGSLL